MLISRTPYRFSFFGGGLDYPEWYRNNTVQVLCAGLDYYCYQTVRSLPPFFNHRYRAVYSSVETALDIDEIKHPSVREVIRAYGHNKSLEMSHVGDLPSKSGIGSSSAFTVGLINSLSALNGEFLGRTKLAQAAIELEQNAMGECVGFQDQCAAAYGGLVLVEADANSVRPRRFVSRSDYLKYVKSNLLMGFDGIERYSSVAATTIAMTIACPSNESLMKDLAAISQRGIEAFGSECDVAELATLTRESRNIKLHLNGDVQNQRTNDLIEATERAGSLCTRVLGAGGGGFFACWAPTYRHETIKASVNIKTWVDVRFSSSGSQVIFSEH